MSTSESIKTILTEQITGYRALLDILRRERECLVHFNAPGVEALSKEKDTIVLKLRLLEEERGRLVSLFASERAIGENVALQRISEITGDESFLRLRLQLISLLQGVTEFNEFNKVLIERSAAVVKNALSFLGAMGATPQTRTTGTLLSREA